LEAKSTKDELNLIVRAAMIPDFDGRGYLPPGIHPATAEELIARFGTGSEIRRVQADSLIWMMETGRRAGVRRLIVNGSFVTDVDEPNDVDCVLLVDENFPEDRDAEAELLAGFPFLDLQVVDAEGFRLLVETIFATDRAGAPKGVVEVTL
jgi:hypothetical protein